MVVVDAVEVVSRSFMVEVEVLGEVMLGLLLFKRANAANNASSSAGSVCEQATEAIWIRKYTGSRRNMQWEHSTVGSKVGFWKNW